jgi:hypothetical protein
LPIIGFPIGIVGCWFVFEVALPPTDFGGLRDFPAKSHSWVIELLVIELLVNSYWWYVPITINQ